jgi:hypothetical protein
MLTCVSSETQSYDVVGAYGEAKMKTHKVKQRGISKATRGLFPEKGDRIEGIWAHGSSRLVSDLQKSGRNGHA